MRLYFLLQIVYSGDGSQGYPLVYIPVIGGLEVVISPDPPPAAGSLVPMYVPFKISALCMSLADAFLFLHHGGGVL